MIRYKMIFVVFVISSQMFFAQSTIIDHTCTDIKKIPESAIIQAKANLHIAYGHTSHGSQLTKGMENLDQFMGGTGLYNWNDGPQDGYLDIDDYFESGDLGHTGDTAWATKTRTYLNNSNNSDVNVIIWSWCGGASDNTMEGMQTYLDKMAQLELQYPNIKFVYMTGHLDGTGLSGNLHIRNEQIRDFCTTNEKILYDFADIESYNPDGIYFGDKIPNDNCDFDTDANGSRDGNWATAWQESHTEGVDWYDCSAAHSKPLNGNRKAYAAWWLWATLSGWNSTTDIRAINNEFPISFELSQNHPNPFNPATKIGFSIPQSARVSITVYNSIGQEIAELANNDFSAGSHSVNFDGSNLSSGMYFYTLKSTNFSKTMKMMLVK